MYHHLLVRVSSGVVFSTFSPTPLNFFTFSNGGLARWSIGGTGSNLAPLHSSQHPFGRSPSQLLQHCLCLASRLAAQGNSSTTSSHPPRWDFTLFCLLLYLIYTGPSWTEVSLKCLSLAVTGFQAAIRICKTTRTILNTRPRPPHSFSPFFYTSWTSLQQRAPY